MTSPRSAFWNNPDRICKCVNNFCFKLPAGHSTSPNLILISYIYMKPNKLIIFCLKSQTKFKKKIYKCVRINEGHFSQFQRVGLNLFINRYNKTIPVFVTSTLHSDWLSTDIQTLAESEGGTSESQEHNHTLTVCTRGSIQSYIQVQVQTALRWS